MTRADHLRVIATSEQIQGAVARLGNALSQDYGDRNPLLLGILKGSFVFLSDLMRSMDSPAQVEFVRASSYGAGTVSTGNVRLLMPLKTPIKGRDIILVEDIIDSGTTLTYLLPYLRRRKPASVRVCALFLKEGRTEFPFPVDYVGMIIPDEFVVGYGLDYAEDYRGLPDLRVLEEQASSPLRKFL
jgi:hypoxanthine phosphoribosyltransferase